MQPAHSSAVVELGLDDDAPGDDVQPPAKRSIAETSARRWAAFSVTTSASSSLTVTVSDIGGLLVIGSDEVVEAAGGTRVQSVCHSRGHGPAASEAGGTKARGAAGGSSRKIPSSSTLLLAGRGRGEL